jgi:hypothetical protein
MQTAGLSAPFFVLRPRAVVKDNSVTALIREFHCLLRPDRPLLRRPDPELDAPGRDLSQRTLSEARHDRIHHSKNTERHSALSVWERR